MWGIIGGIAIVLFFLLSQKKKTPSFPTKPKDEPIEDKQEKFKREERKQEELNLQNAYQKKWVFTYNEKNAFWKLKNIAEKKGYIVFAKVRLIDLLEPVQGNPKYKTLFYKVQSKHVDFVLCDQKLVARIIVELDDSSHEKADRAERDKFVDTILRNTGYKIIRVKAIADDILDDI